MKETGQALPPLYRETATGGIAEAFRKRKKDKLASSDPIGIVGPTFGTKGIDL